MKILCTILVAAITFLNLACAGRQPLYVKMYNPKTKVVRVCSARESSAKDVPALSMAVEACAQHFESRGFVRSDDSSDALAPSVRNESAATP